MRSLAAFALIGSLGFATSAVAQSLAEHAAAASGATIGTAAGKPLSNAITKVFGQVDKDAEKAAGAKAPAKTSVSAPQKDAGPAQPHFAPNPTPAHSSGVSGDPGVIGSGGESRWTPRRRSSTTSQNRTSALAIGPVAPAATHVAVYEPPVRELSAEEVASIKVGTTEKELLATLGFPESRVSIPDDDGHLRQTCQYWAKGKPLATIRLDNGQVVKVEVRSEN